MLVAVNSDRWIVKAAMGVGPCSQNYSSNLSTLAKLSAFKCLFAFCGSTRSGSRYSQKHRPLRCPISNCFYPTRLAPTLWLVERLAFQDLFIFVSFLATFRALPWGAGKRAKSFRGICFYRKKKYWQIFFPACLKYSGKPLAKNKKPHRSPKYSETSELLVCVMELLPQGSSTGTKYFNKEVTIHTLYYLKCIRLVSVRSSLPWINIGARIEP